MVKPRTTLDEHAYQLAYAIVDHMIRNPHIPNCLLTITPTAANESGLTAEIAAVIEPLLADYYEAEDWHRRIEDDEA